MMSFGAGVGAVVVGSGAKVSSSHPYTHLAQS